MPLPSLSNALNHVDLLGDCPLHQERQTGTRPGALRMEVAYIVAYIFLHIMWKNLHFLMLSDFMFFFVI